MMALGFIFKGKVMSDCLYWLSLQYRRCLDYLREWLRMGRLVPENPRLKGVSHKKLKVALVCIAKDEDHYIDEWVDYHLALGVDDIYVYQNDWRAKVDDRGGRVQLVEWDGSCMQLPAYNDFLDRHLGEYDFSIFIDVDEYLCLPGIATIQDFLESYVHYSAIALNWKIFGDSGRRCVRNGDYSLLRRFVRAGRGFDNHVKVIVNMRALSGKDRFVNPHQIVFSDGQSAVTADCRHKVVTAFNYFHSANAWINHYFSKTQEEFRQNKQVKGRSDLPRGCKNQRSEMKSFHAYNQNAEENTVALDFARSHKVVAS